MNSTRIRTLAVLLLAAALGACGRGEHGSVSALGSPAANGSLEALVAASRDCLQYPVETRADGREVWNADYVYFWLCDERSKKLVPGPDGAPLAAGLLPSQAIAFMKAHPELESHCYWTMRLARIVQVSKDGKELERSAPTFYDDFDVDSLLARDAAARRSG